MSDLQVVAVVRDAGILRRWLRMTAGDCIVGRLGTCEPTFTTMEPSGVWQAAAVVHPEHDDEAVIVGAPVIWPPSVKENAEEPEGAEVSRRSAGLLFSLESRVFES